MKRLSVLLAAFAALVSLAAFSAPAEAHGRFRSGVFLQFGVPWPGWWAPSYYYYPPGGYYYYDDYPPAVYVQRPDPPTYIERSDVEAAPVEKAPEYWWYWCPSSEKYYPYVKECPGGFHRVPPQPAK